LADKVEYILKHRAPDKLTAGRLKKPEAITDFNQRIVCLLPVGCYFNDESRDKIWPRFDKMATPFQWPLETAAPG
jgi:hypothetical protein